MISKVWVIQLYCRKFYTEMSGYYLYFLFYWWYDKRDNYYSQVYETNIAFPIHKTKLHLLEIYLKMLKVFIYLRLNLRSEHCSWLENRFHLKKTTDASEKIPTETLEKFPSKLGEVTHQNLIWRKVINHSPSDNKARRARRCWE